MNAPDKPKWSIGREIPVATIAILVIQTVGVIWWAASISAKVEFMSEAVASTQLAQTAIDRRQDDDWRRSEDRIATRLDKVDSKLDRLIEKQR